MISSREEHGQAVGPNDKWKKKTKKRVKTPNTSEGGVCLLIIVNKKLIKIIIISRDLLCNIVPITGNNALGCLKCGEESLPVISKCKRMQCKRK